MDYKRYIASKTLRIFFLFNQVCYVLLSSDHQNSVKGFTGDKCPNGSYSYKQNGNLKCEPCTLHCRVPLVEVKECRSDSNRECHCDRGYYCESKIQFTCRRCKQCQSGTFSNTPNLNINCKPHTDCGQKGMIMLREGNATEDRVCVQASNSPTTTAPAVVHSSDPHLHYSTVLSNPHISSSTGEKVTEHHSSVSNTKFITPNMAYSDTSPAVSGSAPLITTIGDKSLRTGETQIHWLLLVVVILGGVLLYLWCRGRSLPSMNMWKGPTYEKYTQPPQDRNQHLVRPQGREPEGGVGLEGEGSPSPGGLQEVAVEPSGGEKISNTVGSIYIFSPGTVVLGSNKSDKKSNKGESGGEGYSLSSVPQQESRCLLPGGPDVGPEGMITQEETHKELCYPITELNYPVPATEN